MSDLGEFIEGHDFAGGGSTAEDLAEDIRTFLRAEGEPEPEPDARFDYEPTMSEVTEELRRHSAEQTGDPYRAYKERTPDEITHSIALTLDRNRRQNVRLLAVQALRAEEQKNPSWWRKALGLA